VVMTDLRDPTRAPLATLLHSPVLYRRWLERRYPHTHGVPSLPERYPDENAVLMTRDEVDRAARTVRECGLPEYAFAARNWDSLAAFGAVTARSQTGARILDIGGSDESGIASWLWLAGYVDVWCVQPSLRTAFRHADLRYVPGHPTSTPFAAATIDAITCLSTVEHGVDLERYFAEAARLLRPGGVLVTSTDYFPEPTDTRGARANGTDVKVFTRPEVEAALMLAARHGLRPSGPVPLDADEKPVHWDRAGLDYTFVVFTLIKDADVI
jgi:SAM-dependent methyltransferase